MTHAELQRAVTRLCQSRNLLVFTWPDTRLIRRGWVDMVILGPRGGRLVELKSRGAVRSPAQYKVATYMLAGGWPYRLWTPDDWPVVIEADLEALQ